VILWGVLNESASSESDAHATFKKLLGHLRTCDPSRPVTFASNRHGSDRCLDLVDVVCVNAYPGWYFGSIDTLPAELDGIIARYRTAAPGKPIVLSEIGAGALYGNHDHHEQRWSEEFQANLLEQLLRHLPSCDLVGFCLWQFCDTRTSERTETALTRPRGFNNKGLFDEYRRPKLGALALQRLLPGSPETRR
jgi:beta-glucuronidase